ncbi:low molecular weight protein-tyrosine-phosphatase YfkJ [Alicyclobacillus hesperidum]|uniref:protein-tyrosine-phosphatase n=1 Tax=Alicyclobacillus hesperidum TaxID=89784 RepID=A0A1H2RXT0_9BACL|nr:low molecular weight protein-tyrosine-phosphatase [Alicyclobacillus hesperidum]GLV13422.1 low molecular weight protein-tyrosine-phosphatase YfkJ [Alicyclobacillus hesperidum]SDW24276.1 protein-tyrosine phosphatase [Alicyclobacillus hesperidum]
MIRVLFICLGNICRSPMAEAVFRNMVEEAGLADEIDVDSAGIGNWHAGDPPHIGTRRVLEKNGIDWKGLVSRQVTPDDLQRADYVVAMDDANMEALERLGAPRSERVFRLLDLVPDEPLNEVPDPYYDGRFDEVYRLVQLGCRELLQKIQKELAKRKASK